MNATEVVDAAGPEEGCLQMGEVTCWRARAAGQGWEPGAQGGVQALNVGGVEGAQLGLGAAHDFLRCRPGAEADAVFNRN